MLYFWVVNLIKLVFYMVLGFFIVQMLLANLILALVVLLGVYVGVCAHKVMFEGLYFGFVYVVLVVSGVWLIWIALI